MAEHHHGQVPNRYKEALDGARPGVTRTAGELHAALDTAQRAMRAGAWQSPAATDFEHVLAAHRRTVGAAADAAVTELDSALAAQQGRDLVEPGTWEAMFGTHPTGRVYAV